MGDALRSVSIPVPVQPLAHVRPGGLVAADTAGGALTPADLQLLPGFRVRTIPVLGTTPALFGCAAAAWAVCTLAGQPFHSAPPVALAPEQLALLVPAELVEMGKTVLVVAEVTVV